MDNDAQDQRRKESSVTLIANVASAGPALAGIKLNLTWPAAEAAVAAGVNPPRRCEATCCTSSLILSTAVFSMLAVIVKACFPFIFSCRTNNFYLHILSIFLNFCITVEALIGCDPSRTVCCMMP